MAAAGQHSQLETKTESNPFRRPGWGAASPVHTLTPMGFAKGTQVPPKASTLSSRYPPRICDRSKEAAQASSRASLAQAQPPLSLEDSMAPLPRCHTTLTLKHGAVQPALRGAGSSLMAKWWLPLWGLSQSSYGLIPRLETSAASGSCSGQPHSDGILRSQSCERSNNHAQPSAPSSLLSMPSGCGRWRSVPAAGAGDEAQLEVCLRNRHTVLALAVQNSKSSPPCTWSRPSGHSWHLPADYSDL